jgi:hypothetical protein
MRARLPLRARNERATAKDFILLRVAARSVCKKAVRGKLLISVVQTERAMVLVRTTLRNDLNLPTGASSLRRIRIGGDRTKFLNGIDRSITNCSGELARRLVVRIETVDRNVALVCAGAGNRPDAVCRGRTNVVPDDTRLQANQRGR